MGPRSSDPNSFLMDHLSDHGVLAVQMPYNYEEPLYKSNEDNF